MPHDAPNPKPEITIRELYPHLSDTQLTEAEENLERYIALAVRIYERLQADAEADAQFKALTVSHKDHTIRIAKSNPTDTHQPELPT
jgi:hypothetical protein